MKHVQINCLKKSKSEKENNIKTIIVTATLEECGIRLIFSEPHNSRRFVSYFFVFIALFPFGCYCLAHFANSLIFLFFANGYNCRYKPNPRPPRPTKLSSTLPLKYPPIPNSKTMRLYDKRRRSLSTIRI